MGRKILRQDAVIHQRRTRLSRLDSPFSTFRYLVRNAASQYT